MYSVRAALLPIHVNDRHHNVLLNRFLANQLDCRSWHDPLLPIVSVPVSLNAVCHQTRYSIVKKVNNQR